MKLGVSIYTLKNDIRNNASEGIPKGTKVFITGIWNGYSVQRLNPVEDGLNYMNGVLHQILEYYDHKDAEIIFDED